MEVDGNDDDDDDDDYDDFETEAPKCLGDLVEAISAAVFLDCGMDLDRTKEVLWPFLKIDVGESGAELQNVFEVKGVLSGKADLCLPMSGKSEFFCGWLMGFLPYVATKCTANKKKTNQKSLLILGTDRHSFSQWNSGKKATRASSLGTEQS